MGIGIKAPPWSTSAEITEHDKQLRQFVTMQEQRYGSASHQFWSRALAIIFGIFVTAGIIIVLSIV